MTWFNLGLARMRAGNSAAAATAFRKATRLEAGVRRRAEAAGGSRALTASVLAPAKKVPAAALVARAARSRSPRTRARGTWRRSRGSRAANPARGRRPVACISVNPAGIVTVRQALSSDRSEGPGDSQSPRAVSRLAAGASTGQRRGHGGPSSGWRPSVCSTLGDRSHHSATNRSVGVPRCRLAARLPVDVRWYSRTTAPSFTRLKCAFSACERVERPLDQVEAHRQRHAALLQLQQSSRSPGCGGLDATPSMCDHWNGSPSLHAGHRVREPDQIGRPRRRRR